MKRIFSHIAFCALSCLIPVMLNGQTVKIDTVSACPGDTILVPVTTVGFTGVAAMSLIIPYDPQVITFLGMENLNNEIANTMINAVSVPSYEIRAGWFSTGPGTANIGTGKLFDLKLLYHGGALNLTIDSTSELADNNYNVLPTVYISGRVESGPIPLIISQPESVFVCNGAPASITIQASNTLTYQWEINDGGTWTPLMNGSVYSGVNSATLLIAATTPAMHLAQFRCYMTHFCEQYSDIALLHVSNPSVNAGADDTICYGGSTNLSATITGGYAPFSYSWGGAGSGATISVSPASTQPYQVTITDSLGCVATDAVSVIVSHPLTSAGSNDTICLGDSKTITTQTTGGIAPYSYAWQHGGALPQTTVIPTFGQYYKIVVSDFAGCISSDSVYIEVSNPAVYAGDDDTICIYGSAVLMAGATGGYGPYQYLWSHQATTPQTMVSPLLNTQYGVTLTDRFNCVANDQVSIIVSNPFTDIGSDDTLCLGQSKDLTANTTGGFSPYTYNWSTMQSSYLITVLPSSDTTFNVMVTDYFGCPSGDSINLYVSNPSVDAGPQDTICFGAQKTINTVQTGGYTPYQFQWNDNSTGSPIQVSPQSTSWYIVTLTDIAGCTAIDSMLVTVSHPIVSIGDDDTICINSTHTLNAVASGGIGTLQYQWSTFSNQNSIQVSPLVHTYYSVTVTDDMNCQGAAGKMVNVSNPVAGAGPDQGICNGLLATFTATVTGGYAPYSYAWNNQPGQQYQIPAINDTTLYLAVMDKIGCVSEDTALLMVFPNPVLQPLQNDTACYNTTAMLTASASGGTGTISYLWSTNATTPVINPLITQNSQFWVRATDINNCIASDTVIVLVSDPDVNLGADDTTCNGTMVTIIPQVSGGFLPYSYTWSTGGSSSQINVTAQSDTCVSVIITDLAGCTTTDTKCILVSHISANAGPDQAVCQGTQVSFSGTASSGFPPYSYSWNNNPGQQYQFIAGSNTTLVFKAMDHFNCIATDTAMLTVYPNPVLIPIPDDTVCANTAVNLTASASGGTGTLNYLWSTNANTASISPLITQNAQFWVRVTDIHNCQASDTLIVLASEPFLSIGPDDTLCLGQVQSISSQITGGFGPFDYAWSTGGTTPQILLTGTVDTCIHLVITDIIGCNATDTICILVDQLSVDAGPDVMQCPYDPLNLSAMVSGGIGSITYLWSTGASVPNTIAYPSTDSVYTIEVHDQFGCSSMDSMAVNMHPLPLPFLGPDDTICINHIKILDPGAGFTSYLWSTGDNTQTISIDGSVLGVGTYPFSVTVTNSFTCSNSDTVIVVVDPCTSTEDLSLIHNLTLHPNPAKDHTYIELNYSGNYSVQIYNAVGERCLNRPFTGRGNERIRLDLVDMTPGLYLINISAESFNISRKLIIR